MNSGFLSPRRSSGQAIKKHNFEEKVIGIRSQKPGQGGPYIFVFSVQEIILKLHFGDLIGSFVVKIDEHANRACLALLSTLAHPGPEKLDLRFTPTSLQGSHGLIVVILHHNLSPFV